MNTHQHTHRHARVKPARISNLDWLGFAITLEAAYRLTGTTYTNRLDWLVNYAR